MLAETYMFYAFWLALAGVLFAGYMVAHRIILKECPFNESCPDFFGRPACDYGFVMFAVLFGVAALARAGSLAIADATFVICGVSLLGVLFAGYFVVTELGEWLHSGMRRYWLILPTCAYGLIFYIAIFTLSMMQVLR